ncbi:hypothetical protein ABVK25_007671 [Lepraria finkii]|uniref:Uncharacterized protein n=1 Tax=Lepraria finkii TaxID=1340010 RepID=A0ABR4B4Z2_9LECA
MEQSGLKCHLRTSVVDMYILLLTFLCKAHRHYSSSTLSTSPVLILEKLINFPERMAKDLVALQNRFQIVLEAISKQYTKVKVYSALIESEMTQRKRNGWWRSHWRILPKHHELRVTKSEIIKLLWQQDGRDDAAGTNLTVSVCHMI